MSADIINLKDYRRRQAKKADEAQTRANRAKFGRDKVRKLEETQDAKRRESLLDGKRLDDGSTDEPA